jgi:hypothetical protein
VLIALQVKTASFANQVSTQLECTSKEAITNDLKTKFRPLSPINKKASESNSTHNQHVQNKSDLNETTSNKLDITNDEDDHDDESLDAIWIEPDNKIVEDTEFLSAQTPNDEATNLKNIMKTVENGKWHMGVNSRQKHRLFSTESGHSSKSDNSIISDNLSDFGIADQNNAANLDARKRKRRLLSNDHASRFFGDAKSPDDHSKSSSSTSSVQSSPQSCVFELCSKSMIFAPKNSKVLSNDKKSLSDVKKYTKSHLPNIFAPISKSASKQQATSKHDKQPGSTIDLNTHNSAKIMQNSRIIDEILTNKESELNRTNRRRRLFNHNSHEYVEQAFENQHVDRLLPSKAKVNEPNSIINKLIETTVSSKKTKSKIVCYDTTHIENELLDRITENVETIHSNDSATKFNSSETSIPLAQRPPALHPSNESKSKENNISKSSFFCGSNESGTPAKSNPMANLQFNINPNTLQDYLVLKERKRTNQQV